MSAHLVALTEGPSIQLDKPILLVGRHHECDVQIDSRKISRRHCCICQVNDHLVIRDLGSTNGIRLNGTKVTEARLSEQDIITIGTLRYRLTWDEDAASLAPQYEKRQPGDSILEKSDKPVPLSDSGRPLPRQTPLELPEQDDQDGSLIIPDQLDLQSESFRGGSQPPA
jgi:pSer/pThr/pTyr-binding forkhead associated (FHA) protein